MSGPDDDGIEIAPVELDRATRVRLVRLAAVTGVRPLELASKLLRDLLEDDEQTHEPAPPDRQVLN
jgi:NADPH-dependent 2,4-dienoyl-CoA reductase/sulfur reductase-like enzyme